MDVKDVGGRTPLMLAQIMHTNHDVVAILEKQELEAGLAVWQIFLYSIIFLHSFVSLFLSFG
jgi:hypothetical protein